MHPLPRHCAPAARRAWTSIPPRTSFIEGDNLDALKLSAGNYLGKVKMIYIDPPYNTGNDFIYEDDFAEDADELSAPLKSEG
jgi:adenine-specific DNA-methyltransferase